MGIGDIAQTAILKLKADTSDYRAKMRQVQGDEKAVVKAQLEAAEARNKGYERAAAGLSKFATGIGVVTAAFKVGADAYKAYDEHQRLSAASSKYNLDALRKSSAGLRTDLDLMRLAQKAAGSQHSISQLQLESATAAMRAFERAGFEGAKVQEKVGEALLKGSIEPLKDLGVNLDLAKGKTGQMSQLFEQLGIRARGAGDGVNAQTDAFTKAGVEYKNAINQMEVAIGELVVSLTPLISKLAELISMSVKFALEVGDFLAGPSDGYRYRSNAELRQQSDWEGRYKPGFAQIQGVADGINAQNADANRRLTFLRTKDLTERAIAGGPVRPKSRGGGKSKADSPIGYVELENTGEVVPIWMSLGGPSLGRTIGSSGGPTDAMLGAANDRSAYYGGQEQERVAAMIADLDKFTADGIRGQNTSKLAKIFGPISDFNEYAAAFDTLSGSIKAGFDAWVSGSGSATAAIKKHFAGSVSAMASELFAKSIAWGATGVAEMFMPGMQGMGAAHLKGAAGMLAASITVGGIARQLGGGGGAAGGGASAGGGRAPSVTNGGGAGAMGGNYTVIVGDVWAADNQRKKDREVARAIRSADRELQGAQGVTRR
jgi:hypothetical protein